MERQAAEQHQNKLFAITLTPQKTLRCLRSGPKQTDTHDYIQ